MPENDAEARSRERREEAQQQQELLNSIRDNRSIFTDGQMEGDNAKDWMSRNPGDAFQNIVKISIKFIEFENTCWYGLIFLNHELQNR